MLVPEELQQKNIELYVDKKKGKHFQFLISKKEMDKWSNLQRFLNATSVMHPKRSKLAKKLDTLSTTHWSIKGKKCNETTLTDMPNSTLFIY